MNIGRMNNVNIIIHTRTWTDVFLKHSQFHFHDEKCSFLLSWECRSPLSTTNSAASIRFARHRWTTFHRLEHNKVSDGQSNSPEKSNQPSINIKDKLTVFASIDDLRTIESSNGRTSTNLNSHFVNGTKLNHKDENIIRTFTVDTDDLLSALALNWHRSSLSTISLLSPDIARYAIIAVPSPLHSVCQLSFFILSLFLIERLHINSLSHFQGHFIVTFNEHSNIFFNVLHTFPNKYKFKS